MIPESSFDSSAKAAGVGAKDIQSVFFVNVLPRRDGRSPDNQRQLDEAKACIDLHNQYLALGIEERFTVEVKNAKLPTSGAIQDQVARSNYNATSTASWLTQISGWYVKFCHSVSNSCSLSDQAALQVRSDATNDEFQCSRIGIPYKASEHHAELHAYFGFSLRQIRTSASSTFEFDLTAVQLPSKEP